jgi:hypothetical protein
MLVWHFRKAILIINVLPFYSYLNKPNQAVITFSQLKPPPSITFHFENSPTLTTALGKSIFEGPQDKLPCFPLPPF